MSLKQEQKLAHNTDTHSGLMPSGPLLNEHSYPFTVYSSAPIDLMELPSVLLCTYASFPIVRSGGCSQLINPFQSEARWTRTSTFASPPQPTTKPNFAVQTYHAVDSCR